MYFKLIFLSDLSEGQESDLGEEMCVKEEYLEVKLEVPEEDVQTSTIAAGKKLHGNASRDLLRTRPAETSEAGH